MLNKHELPVQKEEAERVDTLRYSWLKLTGLAFEQSNYLIDIQPNYKSGLIEDVKTFIQDSRDFYSDYDTVSTDKICFKL